MRTRSALATAAMFLLLPKAASAAFCPESFMQPFCTQNDMVEYRGMVNAINDYIKAEVSTGAQLDLVRVTLFGTSHLAKMSKLCQAAFNACQSPQATNGGCTRRQVQKMIEENSHRGPDERAETNCFKYPP